MHQLKHLGRGRYLMKLFAIALVLLCLQVNAEPLQEFYRKGEYKDALKLADKKGADLHTALSLYKTLGRYDDAFDIWLFSGSRSKDISLLYEGIELYKFTGYHSASTRLRKKLNASIEDNSLDSPLELVTRGKLALENGYEAVNVLENFYDLALKKDPLLKEAYMASAELAFSKDDMKTVAAILHKANELIPNDPDIIFALALAFAGSDPMHSQKLIEEAEAINPRHLGLLKYQLQKALFSEDEEKMPELIGKIKQFNKNDPEFLALQACRSLAKKNDARARELREKALNKQKSNPLVDYTIGYYLSYNGKFEEANKYLHQALSLDPKYHPAKIALALNSLRTGQTDKGFQLAREVYEEDNYNLTAFNLGRLEDVFNKFSLIKNDNFSIRINQRDAELYGDVILQFLADARRHLEKKYDFKVTKHTYVDLYRDAANFAIRNFAYPAESGALGVCFGNFVTVKTVEALDQPYNWQEILWHEYVHVVTLAMSKKNVPRWMTEGISVYEEWLGGKGWGRNMGLDYRKRILNGELIPLKELNSSFHGGDVIFAYYQGGLLINYLVETYGIKKLRACLLEMAGDRKPMDIIEAVYASAETLDKDFAAYAVEKARKFSGQADLSELPQDFQGDNLSAIEIFLKENPNHFSALNLKASILHKQAGREELEETLLKTIELFPLYIDEGNAYIKLAELYKLQDNTAQEYAILKSYCDLDSNKWRSLKRVIEMAIVLEDWPAAKDYSRRLIAVHPLLSISYKAQALAALEQKDKKSAIDFYRKVLSCKDPTSKTDTHFALATLLKEKDAIKSKRHLLRCLEESPRYRAAYKLLVELNKNEK